MSYNITVKVQDGVVTLDNISGEVPPGEFIIYGHLGDGTPTNYSSVGITRRDEHGQFAGSASASHRQHQPVTMTLNLPVAGTATTAANVVNQ